MTTAIAACAGRDPPPAVAAAPPDLSLIVAMAHGADLAQFHEVLGAYRGAMRWEIVTAGTQAIGTAGVFRQWRAGLDHARGRYLAILDARCPPQAGWPAAVAAAIATQQPVFFGPVICEASAADACMVGYLSEYVQFLPPIDAANREVPGNNVIFTRDLVDDAVRSLPEFHKTFFIERVRAAGVPVARLDAAVVRYLKHYAFGHYLRRRHAHGRQYAALRVGRFVRARLLLTPLLPLLRLRRLWAATRAKPAARAALLRHFAPVLLSEIAWSAGEAAGYLTRRGAAEHLLD